MAENADNLWREIEFNLNGLALTRRLVPDVRDFEAEISKKSPVGRALLHAQPEETVPVRTPEGTTVTVNVISITS